MIDDGEDREEEKPAESSEEVQKEDTQRGCSVALEDSDSEDVPEAVKTGEKPNRNELYDAARSQVGSELTRLQSQLDNLQSMQLQLAVDAHRVRHVMSMMTKEFTKEVTAEESHVGLSGDSEERVPPAEENSYHSTLEVAEQ